MDGAKMMEPSFCFPTGWAVTTTFFLVHRNR
jgi:hypothetical protein